MALIEQLRDLTWNHYDDLVDLRHRLHQHPEIGLDLPETQRIVLEALKGLPLEISVGQTLSSVTAVLRGGRPGPAVLLRGDMDGLPLQEKSGLNFASQVDGAMHACGHDLHTAMLVGAARVLSTHRDEMAGDVVFMFQPGEEGYNGAGHMLNEGVLEAAGRRVSSAYGLHVYSSEYPRGVFTTRPGTLMAASDALHVTVHGQGGHGSIPHVSKDPIPVAAEIITALQTMVARRFDIFDPVVVTVGTLHAGTRFNIIPDDAEFEAAIRSFSRESRDRIVELAPKLCRDIAAAHGLLAEVEYKSKNPLTVNSAAHADFAAGVVREVFGEERFALLPNPNPGAEDFSRVLEEVPGCYIFLGAHAGDDPAACASNHSPRAVFVDEVIPDGVLLLTQLAIQALRRDATSAAQVGVDP